MRTLALYMFTSLDGFIAGPNGEFDDYEPSDEEHRFANEVFGGAAGIVFGRTIYEGFVEYWDSFDVTSATAPPLEAEFARVFRRLPRIVVSRTLKSVDPRGTLITDNVAGEVRHLKTSGDGYLMLVCGPELLGTLMAHHLVDEYRVIVKPTVQGHGKPLFGNVAEKQRLRLLATREFSSGAVLHHYAS